MAKNRKATCELLLPAATGWERWSTAEDGTLNRVETSSGEPLSFSKDVQRRVLALPVSQTWVLPAWLKGEAAHMRDMAQLHLERLGVRSGVDDQTMQVRLLTENDGAHLVSIVALKDEPTPLENLNPFPDEVLPSVAWRCVPLNSIVVWRELGRLVVAISSMEGVIYSSPLSSVRLDEHALGELNNICLQLGFQKVLARVDAIVLWLEDEGDPEQIRRVTGIPAIREDIPAPVLLAKDASALKPLDLRLEEQRQDKAARNRLLALTAGALVAAGIAIVATLTSMAVRERNDLREKVASLAPRAARVMDHQRAWKEAAPAVDPSQSVMQLLMDCMSPESSTEVTMMHFEYTPTNLILRGRTPDTSLALRYAQEMKENEALLAFTWETPPPAINNSDNSATFEMKGTRP